MQESMTKKSWFENRKFLSIYFETGHQWLLKR